MRKSAVLPKPRKSRPARPLGLTIAAVALLAVLALAWQWNRPEILAARWQERLAALPDAEVEPQLKRIVELGDAGLPVLTAALGSERECVRSAARPLLIEEVGRWELLPTNDAAAKLSILAAALAKSSAQFDASNRSFAADIALRILDWPHEDDGARRAAQLADCEAVLTATATSHTAPIASPANRLDVHQAGSAAADHLATTPSSDAISVVDSMNSLPAEARLPGGALPVELASLPSPLEIGASHADHRDKSAAVEPNRLPERIVSRPLDEASEPPALLQRAPVANQPRRLPSPEDGLGNTRLLHAQADHREPAELLRPGDEGVAAWKHLDLREVMRELHATDPELVSAAQAELKRRGVTGALVELARRAADPNPTVRQQLAESLPRMPGVDARPWLLELSYDDDPTVRATAVTLMATSGDLELLKRVQQISLDDPDDHTRAQAEKALPTSKRKD